MIRELTESKIRSRGTGTLSTKNDEHGTFSAETISTRIISVGVMGTWGDENVQHQKVKHRKN
jgi:hypothetical protein